MLRSARAPRRELVDRLPQFLTRRLQGWDGLQPLLAAGNLARRDALLLRALVMETDPGAGMTEAELRADLFNPYTTFNPIFESLPALLGQGYVARHGEQYTATPQGRALVARIERAARAYVASKLPPTADSARLVDTLADIADSLWSAAEPRTKPHQARVRRLPPGAGEPPLARLDPTVYALWMARDDAHNTAWRAAGFDGPTFDILSRIWSGAADSRPQLLDSLRYTQRPDDVEHGLAKLIEQGDLIAEEHLFQLTPAGRATRDAIEAETDRVYFAPWPQLAPDQSTWLYETFRALCERLP